MTYKCPACGVIRGANDGQILAILPAHIRQIYPCDPKYCHGTFHFNVDLTDDLELLMCTYANASFVGKKLGRKLGLQYTRKVETYFSQNPSHPFLSFDAFIAGFLPPSSASIRALYQDGFYSPLTPYGYSQYDRIVREMQNVRISPGDTIACDWTFQVTKNYNIKGAKAIFTANVGRTNEVFALAIVATTAISQVSHMLVEIMEKRQNFDPSVLYHDTCPNNADFWKALFGTHVDIRLGLFHLLHRIVDTLDSKSEVYWKALVDLKKTVYKYNSTDYSGLLTSLSDGSFDRAGRKYTPREIEDLRHSKRWKQRMDVFLRKEILPGPIIGQGLSEWIQKHKDSCDAQGRLVFTRHTEKVAREQVKKCSWAEDPPGVKMYQKIPSGKRSTHKLPKWLSNRPESGLEKFHESLAHMANTGSGAGLADALTLAGTGDHNIKARWREFVNKQKLSGQKVHGTVEYEDTPPFWDHAYLDLLNRRAGSLGMDPIFNFVTAPSEDNGEVFLSAYFEQQKKRNESVGVDKGTKFCRCVICKMYSPPVSKDQSIPPRIDVEIANASEGQQQQNLTNQEVIHELPIVDISPQTPVLEPQPLVAAQPRITLAHPPMWRNMPFKPCFEWFPFYCMPKKEYYDNKLHGQGRSGRPPKCVKNCYSHHFKHV
jgi:hypothetical protein